MLRDRLTRLLFDALRALTADGIIAQAAADTSVEVLDTKQPEHGDYASNIAMAAAKAAGTNPRALAELIREQVLKLDEGALLTEVEIAGPGFLNFRLKSVAIVACVSDLLAKGTDLSKVPNPNPQRINVEFVSVNPNGPITIGSGRGAAYGSTLCNVLEAAGHKVHREYYINDGTNSEQMRLFAQSVRSLYEEVHLVNYPTPIGEVNKEYPFPPNGYKGDYVYRVAEELFKEKAPRFAFNDLAEEPIESWQYWAQALMLKAQKLDLRFFNVHFDCWFSEQTLHDSSDVERSVESLRCCGVADDNPIRTVLKLARGGKIEGVEKQPQTSAMETEDEDAPGIADTHVGSDAKAPPAPDQAQTLWLRSTKFGDDMDRVLRRKDGRFTYIASDVAYHKDKFNRGSKPDAMGHTEKADKLITILGPDHHGYIGRLTAVVAAALMSETPQIPDANSEPLTEIEGQIYESPEERDRAQAALALAREKLEVQIYQLVRFMKEGKPAPMRKRDGNIYALIDLIDEIGEKVKPNGSNEDKQEAGKDVARFFYLMRSHDTTFDFDLDLAAKQSDENPVFYVQYAHARISSILRKAADTNLHPNQDHLDKLIDPRELALVKKILDLPYEVERAAADYGVHRLATYAIELARTFHHFYDGCRVIQEDRLELSTARLALCGATQLGLKGALDLLGISAPERMDRAEPAA